MTDTQIHPYFLRRRQEVQSDREEKYDIARTKIIDDLRRTISTLVTVNNKTNLDLISVHIDLARTDRRLSAFPRYALFVKRCFVPSLPSH